MNLHKGNPDSPTGNLLVFCNVQGKSPLHPDARIIVTNVVVSFVSASSNSFPVVIFPPDSLFSQGELDQLIGLNEFYDVLQVEDFDVPTSMDESDYIQERMEQLNQSVIEYVELCRHYIESRTEEIPADEHKSNVPEEEPATEKSALDSIHDFLMQPPKAQIGVGSLELTEALETSMDQSIVQDASLNVSETIPEEVPENVFEIDPGQDLDHDPENDLTIDSPNESHNDSESITEIVSDIPLDDGPGPNLNTPRIQEVEFDSLQGAQVKDAMRFLKFNYPKYDIERFERILNQPGHSARKLARLYMEKYRAVFDERYEVAAELKNRIEKLEGSLFPSG